MIRCHFPIDSLIASIGRLLGCYRIGKDFQFILPLLGQVGDKGVQNICLRIDKGVVDAGAQCHLLSLNKVVPMAVGAGALCQQLERTGAVGRLACLPQTVADEADTLHLTAQHTRRSTQEDVGIPSDVGIRR